MNTVYTHTLSVCTHTHLHTQCMHTHIHTLSTHTRTHTLSVYTHTLCLHTHTVRTHTVVLMLWVFSHICRMAHWFHRNPLKATAPVSFNLYGVAGSPAANKICKCVSRHFLLRRMRYQHHRCLTIIAALLFQRSLSRLLWRLCTNELVL